jgi:small subunit ribosomal protein S6
VLPLVVGHRPAIARVPRLLRTQAERLHPVRRSSSRLHLLTVDCNTGLARETVLDRTRTYECMCLLDNREVRKGWEPLKATVAGLFTKHGAEVLSARRWDERRLAYPINGQQRGTFLLTYVKVGTDQLAAIRRELQFSEPVLRTLMHVCDDIPQEAYEPEAEFDVNAIPQDDAPQAEAQAPAAEAEAEAEQAVAEGEEAAAEGGEAAGEGEAAEAEAEGESAAGEGEEAPAAETTDEEKTQ